MRHVARSLFAAAALLLSIADCKPEKELDLETARSMVEDIYGALSNDEATAAIAAATPQTELGGMKARLNAILPVAEELTKDVRTKYGVGKELQDAMEAAGRVGEKTMDKKLSDAIQQISEIIIGEESPRRIGRVHALDALADGFIALDAAGRTERVRKAESVLTSLDDEATSLDGKAAGAAMYLEAMRGIVAEGDDFVIDKVVQSVVLLGPEMDEEGAKTTNRTKKEIHIRLNVLAEFLGLEDHKRVGDRVEAAMKEHAEGVAGKEEL